MDGELAYYAATSGLAPANEFSLMDHARAAGIDPVDYAYWAGLSGLGNGYSLADHKRMVISGGSPEPPAGIVGAFLQALNSLAGTAVYTFSAQPIGTATPERRIVVAVSYRLAATLISVTIGGVSATIDGDSFASVGTNRRATIASAVVPSGTTADVVATLSGATPRCGIGMWRLDGAASLPSGEVVSANTFDPVSMLLPTEPGDFAVGMVSSRVVDTTTINWTAANERYDLQLDAVHAHSGADATAVGLSVDMGSTLVDPHSSEAPARLAVGYRAA